MGRAHAQKRQRLGRSLGIWCTTQEDVKGPLILNLTVSTSPPPPRRFGGKVQVDDLRTPDVDRPFLVRKANGTLPKTHQTG